MRTDNRWIVVWLLFPFFLVGAFSCAHEQKPIRTFNPTTASLQDCYEELGKRLSSDAPTKIKGITPAPIRRYDARVPVAKADFEKIKNDAALSFEVALYKGYNDIAQCLAEKTTNQSEISRMLSPAIKYLHLSSYDILMKKNPDVNTKYPNDGSPPFDADEEPIFHLLANIDEEFPGMLMDYFFPFPEKELDLNVKNHFYQTPVLLLMRKKQRIDAFLDQWIQTMIELGGKPERLYFSDSGLDDFHNLDFTKYTVLFDEKPFIDKSDQGTAFRFLYIRSFDGPVMVKVYSDTESKKRLVFKMANLDTGKIEKEVQREVSEEEWKTLNEKVSATDFWNMPTDVPRNDHFLDGVAYFIDAVDGTKHHVVYRHSPEADKYRELGLYLIELTGVKIAPLY